MTGIPLSGSKPDELLLIETDQITLTIKGKGVHPRIEASLSSNALSTIRIQCSDRFLVKENGYIRDEILLNNNNLSLYMSNLNDKPIFYEQQNYELVVISRKGSIVEFWHDNINIRNRITPVGSSGEIVSGIVNFGNEIGYSDLEIWLHGCLYMRVTIEVFTSKISYKEDYLALMADVTDEVYNLAFDFLKKTHLESSSNTKSGSSLTEFFSIIRIIFKDFPTTTQKPDNLLTLKKKGTGNSYSYIFDAKEYLNSYEIDELADIYEVLLAILTFKGVSEDEFQKIRLTKHEKTRGL